jgi:two-component system chemotaxis sensor kinase CheA
MDDLLPEFLTETNEALAELDLALVKLEGVPNDQATLSLIFRLVHTIKGTCGFLGLPRLEHVAHAAENVLGRVRDGELAATPDVISLVLAALDRIKLIVAELGANGAEPQGDDGAVIGALNQVASGQPAPQAEAPVAPKIARRRRASGSRATVLPQAAPVVADRGADLPAADMPSPAVTQAGAHPATQLATPEASAQTIRVAVDVLEELMTLVGELVLTRNQLLQLSRTESAGDGVVTAFSSPLQRLSHITSDLQDKVMKTRMQPIGTAWNKLPRLVRDLAQETGKTIVLEMRGQDTELDRQVLELMRDPLTHMVRNSADHGLETSAERRAAGKPEAGRIMLNAYHEGGHIIIEISDDGRGIDVGRVRAKALAKGLATEAELAAMSDAQIRAFIFRAGFSTAEAVTAISGRGVGMDVVRSNIERIGGTIELVSTQGAGSCFTIKIPLTLAIVSAVIVRSAGERFAIPQIAVRELVRAGDHGTSADQKSGPADAAIRIEQVGGAAVLRLRDELLPLVNLATLLRLEQHGNDELSKESTVVVVAIGPLKLGIVVDEVFDTEEIVVKPVAPVLRHVTMFSGNTILGDGSVIMILDPNGVARTAGIAARSSRADVSQDALTRAGSEEQVALLLFRAGGRPGLFAVPLSLVARLETIASAQIEPSSSGYVTQYRGQLMKLIAMQDADRVEGAAPHAPGENQSVLVFADGARSMGLMVDSIVDVLHGKLNVELGSQRSGVLGTAVIGGQAADVLDTGYWLTLAWQDWFANKQTQAGRRPHILVVEDSDFFRQLLVPALSAAGYDVTSARDAEAALALRDSGLVVDAVVSDIEMPGMGGLEFARQARRGGAWHDLPIVALSGHEGHADELRAREAGFTAYVSKNDRQGLVQQLRDCLAAPADQTSAVA